jgi:Icc-related predicted phosphoesterase
MKLLYATDLHGNRLLFDKLFSAARQEKADAVIIGGDLAPHYHGTLPEVTDFQRNFLISILKSFIGFDVYIMMGNDDLRINMDVLEKAEDDGVLHLLSQKVYKLDGFSLAGYSFVNPTPFRFKDWEKQEGIGDNQSPTIIFGQAIRTTPHENKETIKEDLDNMGAKSNPAKTIYIFHSPPFNTGLDLTSRNIHVGSTAIRNFIEEKQPMLTLHGHIHESPLVSGVWKEKIGNTICINPGSSSMLNKLHYVTFEPHDLNTIKYGTI